MRMHYLRILSIATLLISIPLASYADAPPSFAEAEKLFSELDHPTPTSEPEDEHKPLLEEDKRPLLNINLLLGTWGLIARAGNPSDENLYGQAQENLAGIQNKDESYEQL